MSEIIFEVREDETDGGYTASALGGGIHTEAETLDELRRNVREAVDCYYEDPLQAPAIMAQVKSRNELKIREEKIGGLISASKALLDLAEHGPELYRQELMKCNLPRDLRESSVKVFAASFSASNPHSEAWRQAEVRQSQTMLQLLTLLDGAWGKWEYKPATRKIEFNDPAMAAKYNAKAEELNQAIRELQALRQNMPQDTNSK